jgi:hypothetical protein
MTMLDWQTFVLQRRINRPSQEVLHAISNPAVFGSGAVLSSDADGALRLEEPFRRVGRSAVPVWRANARLTHKHGRRLAAVEIEISPWSAIDTELLIRPRARNPQGWSSRRLRQYFAHAHRSADDLTHLLRNTTYPRVTHVDANA